MNFEIPREFHNIIEIIRWLGREYLRPIGIEYDRKGEPVPPDHPFYYEYARLGFQARMAGIREEEFKEKNKKEEKKGEKWDSRLGVIVGEETSYWDRGVAVSLPGPGLGGPPVRIMGTDEQKKRFLTPFLTREKPLWGAFAMTEPGAGSDVARISTKCEKKGTKWILNGEKAFCSNADKAEWIVVWATIDKSLGRAGHRAFVVQKGTPGFYVTRIEKKMGLTAYASCSLLLENCEVPEENLLGGEEYYKGKEGFKGAMKSFDATRPVIASMAVGVARAAYDRMIEFVKENYNLSRPVPRYRKIREKILWARRNIEIARMLCWKAAWMADLEIPNTREASEAKAFAPQVALETISLCMDIMSDAGVRNDYYVEKLFRDVKALDIVEGTGQIQRLVIARRVADYPKEE